MVTTGTPHCWVFLLSESVVVLSNTKFKPLLLLTRAGICYTNTHKHRTSLFKSTLTFLGPSNRWKSISSVTDKNGKFLRFFIINIIISRSSFHPSRFLRAPYANTIKLISIGSYFPEVRAFGTLITSNKQLKLNSGKDPAK